MIHEAIEEPVHGRTYTTADILAILDQHRHKTPQHLRRHFAPIKATCEVCAREFEPWAIHARYCGDKCKRTAQQRRYRAKVRAGAERRIKGEK